MVLTTNPNANNAAANAVRIFRVELWVGQRGLPGNTTATIYKTLIITFKGDSMVPLLSQQALTRIAEL